jgi:SAM-dependent methyltransferase
VSTTGVPDYDAIADLYDVDMGRNMPFDDVGFYLDCARQAAGPVLELGCGNGRILLALLAGGVTAFGADASARMLRALADRARARAMDAPVARMDVRSLAFADSSFDCVLCPYSLITYMRGPDDAHSLLTGIARVLRPGGRVVVDAFVPRQAAASNDFRPDYRRPLAEGSVERTKRVTPLDARHNRIERRYRVLDAGGSVLHQVETCEEIRLFTPEELQGALSAGGFEVERVCWDYASGPRTADTQFCTVLASRS